MPFTTAQSLTTTFDSANDLTLFNWGSAGWSVAGGAASTTLTAPTERTLAAGTFNLLGGSLTVNVAFPAGAPTGFYGSVSASVGDSGRAYFDFDGYGLSARVEVWGAATSQYIGQYNASTHAWLRINLPTSGVPSFQYSSDGAAWKSVAGTAFPVITSPRTFAATDVAVTAGAWQTISASTTQVLSVTATGPNITDRSKADPGPGTLILAEDFTTLDKTRWSVDDQASALVAGANTSVVSGALRFAIAGGKGARAYWFSPPISRYGRLEYRMRLSDANALDTGPAVMWYFNGGNWADGEVDIFEGESGVAYFTDHFFPNPPGTTDDSNHRRHRESRTGDFTQYHVWTVEWTPTLLRAWIDGRLLFSTNDSDAIPRKPMDLRIHNRFEDGITPTGRESGYLDIDYIRFYALPMTELR